MSEILENSEQIDAEGNQPSVLSKFTFITDVPMKSLSKEDGKKRVRLTASTDAEDLVGDVMSKNALKQMLNAAPGTTIFLNHDASVPYSVFGAVEKASLVERKVPVTTEDGTKAMTRLNCLDYDVVVEDTNQAALDTYKIIDGGRVQLGASVTIGITKASPLKGGRTQIDDVVYLETSIVGIPCNQTAWATPKSEWANYVKSNGWYQRAMKSWKKAGNSVDLVSLEGTPVDLDSPNIVSSGSFQIDATGTIKAANAKLISEKQVKVEKMSNDNKTVVKTTIQKAANLAEAVVAFKDLFTEQVEEHFESPWLYMDLLSYALMDLLWWNVAMPSDEKMAAAKEMLAAFAVKMEEILTLAFAEEDAEKSMTLKKQFLAGAANSLETAMKAGKRNNKTDKKRIQGIHDLAVELEADCMTEEKSKTTDEKVTPVVEIKEAPAVEDQAKAIAALQAGVDTLEAEKATWADTQKGLEDKIKKFEEDLQTSKEEVAKWKAMANTAAALVEKHLSAPAK